MPYTVQKPDNFAEKSDNITKASNNDGIQKDPSTQKDNSAEGDKTPQKGKSAEEVRLLIACLRPESRPNGVVSQDSKQAVILTTNSQQIDYQKVAEECNIVGKDGDPSKGAA